MAEAGDLSETPTSNQKVKRPINSNHGISGPPIPVVETGSIIQSTKEPDGGYGWVCVICMLLITAHTWGVNGAFGVYLAHYLRTNSFPGTAETTFAFIGGLSISQLTCLAPVVTKFSQRFGTLATLLIGVLLETVALVGASFATEVWQLFLSQGLLFGWGCCFLYVGAVGIVPQWFNKRRGIANGIAAAGSGLGGLVYSLGSEAIIDNLGLAWAFRITAICTFVVNTICALLIRDRNMAVRPSQHAFDTKLFSRYEFLLVVIWGCFSTLGYTVILFSIPDNALKIGLTSKQGAVAGALANLGMAIGRPIVGYFSDSFGRINMVGSATVLCALFCFCIWTSAQTYAVLLVFALLVGTVCGTYYAVIGPLLADVLDLRVLPAALSIMWTFSAIPTLFAEPIAQKLRLSNGPVYLPVQLFAGGMFLIASICMLFLRAHQVSLHMSEVDLRTEIPFYGEVPIQPQKKRVSSLQYLRMMISYMRI